MIEQLFGSKTRVKLLRLFFSNPNRSFYVREITRKIDEQINSVRRELANLLSIGIISSDTTNNRLYYEVNQSYELYEPLRMMFGSNTSDNKKEPVAAKATHDDTLESLGNVELAVYTGQFTRDMTSEVDILIVGDINRTRLANFITALEANEGKDLRYTLMDKKEFDYRHQIKDRFLTELLSSKMQILIDKHSLLDAFNKDK
jgi:predicted transcriptional regulator